LNIGYTIRGGASSGVGLVMKKGFSVAVDRERSIVRMKL
jgi:hypothetical protein